ncbi:hypothetical protein HELRODRAFT_175162 [Helobdella robusta]|uniref:RNA polymerase II nuclear localization protein SLC7A6OS n=1 Tax=Helobdella robusta TaxID=6412 RepID=T1F8X9_HELRO|nr:hypothetical protein HELRODRAFT_175162 [Helobdella robusta]ESO01132.1 hypothetical protein HELRODRAFT_175162 [Helobdella robusta]
MAAIVRIKRRRDEDPVDSLVFVCKKAKLCEKVAAGDEEQQELLRIEDKFKFAGTVDDLDDQTNAKDDSVIRTVRSAIKKRKLENEQMKVSYQAAEPQQVRKPNKSLTKGYAIIGQKTADNLDSLGSSKKESVTEESKYFLFNLEKIEESSEAKKNEIKSSISCNDATLTREKVSNDKNYVYDIFYMNDYKFDFSLLQNIESVEAYRETYDFQYLEDADEEVYEDEDNEDDESNWRNDYPDENLCFYESDDDYNGSDYENDDLNCFGVNETDDMKAIVSHVSRRLSLGN